MIMVDKKKAITKAKTTTAKEDVADTANKI